MSEMAEPESSVMSGRHQLVVLTLKSASQLPAPSPSYSLVVRGELSGVRLEADPVTVTSSVSDLEEQQLVWEVSQTQLRQFRSRKVMMRVELWLQQQLLGHFVLDLRTAQPVSDQETGIVFKPYKLLGSQVTVEVGLSLEETESNSVDITDDTDDEVQVISHTDRSLPLQPTLIEESEDGEGGYFLIGEKSNATETFSLSLSLVTADHLALVVDEKTVLQDPFYWQYNILGVDISSEQFPSLDTKESFESEKATATIRSSRAQLSEYLSRSSVSIKLCSGAVVLAAAELQLDCLIQAGQLQDSVKREVRLQLVSGHSLTVRQDTEGNTPSLGVSVELQARQDVITSGKLSDSEDLEEVELTPTKLPTAEEISPKKLRLSQSPLRPAQPDISPSPGVSSVSLDATNYLEMYRKTKPTPDRSKQFDLSVDLLSIVVEEEGFNVTDAVLLYKYLALYKDPIQTDPFSLSAGKPTNIPNGYCQFSFYVGEEKMMSTFEQHHMKIGLYVANQIICMASINLANVVRSGDVWREKVDLLRKDSGEIIGQLEIELKLKVKSELEREAETETGADSKEKLVATKDLISKAVMDLEAWKTEQKRKFNENLLNIEAQHLNLLGQEWKERELERERVAQEKMAVMKSLEEELRQELEKIEIERKEINEKSKSLETEKLRIETEKANLKNEKVSVIDRLKHQVRERETEISIKNSEINLLTQKVNHLETEIKRKGLRKPSASSSSSQEKPRSDEMMELNQLKGEKLSWKASLEQTEKERDWYKNLFEEARSELSNVQKQKEKMYSDKIAALERRVRELSGEKPETEFVQRENSHEENQRVNVEIQTSLEKFEGGEKEASMEGLMRLEDNLAMLLRTGVYAQTDPVVLKLRQQIKKLKSSVKADKDSSK